MIKSMTGFGKTEFIVNNKKIIIEIRTLNSKSLDLNVRINNPFKDKELEIRKKIATKLVRGKVVFNFFVEYTGGENLNIINKKIVKNYISQLKEIAKISDEKALDIATKFPNVLNTLKEEEFDIEEWKTVTIKIDETLKAIDIFRIDEGSILKADFNKRIKILQQLSKDNIVFENERIPVVKKKILKSLNELKQDIDKNRFEQELIYYLEKYDITEENVRLNNHLKYFLTALNVKESNGKKLGFICQEIGREINTIGSKANYAPMQQNVVLMKDELEKIKEQLLNVL
ncbi:MAG: YicC family protein [Flavobacteriaceae bacterium]|nr:YicC family protein [Flavobacteriaceae bacterium]